MFSSLRWLAKLNLVSLGPLDGAVPVRKGAVLVRGSRLLAEPVLPLHAALAVLVALLLPAVLPELPSRLVGRKVDGVRAVVLDVLGGRELSYSPPLLLSK